MSPEDIQQRLSDLYVSGNSVFIETQWSKFVGTIVRYDFNCVDLILSNEKGYVVIPTDMIIDMYQK